MRNPSVQNKKLKSIRICNFHSKYNNLYIFCLFINDVASASSSDISETDDEKFPDGYDKDFLGDAEDKEKLNNMNELDRENEMYRRMEVREELMKQKKAAKILKKKRKEERRKQREEQLQKNRSAQKDSSDDSDSDVDSDDSDTNMKIKKSSKKGKIVESEEESSDEISSSEESSGDEYIGGTTEEKRKRLQAKQQKKLDKERRRKEKRKKELAKLSRNTLKVDDIFSGSESSDDDKTKVKKTTRKGHVFSSDGESGEIGSSDDDKMQDDIEDDRVIETFEELNRAKLSRFRCEQWCATPWFAKSIAGTYVRIGLGVNKETGREVHRVCEVVGILKTQTPYVVNDKCRTNVALNVKLGDSKRGFKILYRALKEDI